LSGSQSVVCFLFSLSLVVLVLLTLHGDFLAHVLVADHADSEELGVLWSLVVLVFLTFHGDFLAHVLVADHTNGEELGVVWSLGVLVLLALHGDLLAEVFVTDHADSEELMVSWNSLSLAVEIIFGYLLLVHAGGKEVVLLWLLREEEMTSLDVCLLVEVFIAFVSLCKFLAGLLLSVDEWLLF